MSTLISRMFCLSLLVGQGACIAVAVPRINPSPDPAPGGKGRGVRQGLTIVDSPAVGSKAVVGKQPPNLLIAQDGSQCTVPQEKYAQVALGRPMVCIWGDPVR